MAKLVTSPVGNFNVAGLTTLQNNFDAIEEAMENTLSRDGTTPNQMEADFDMNGNDIINVGSLETDSLTINDLNLNTLVEEATEQADRAEDAADRAEAAAGNAGVDYATRAAFVSAISGGLVPINGQVYWAAGLSYIGTTGATAISDLPGVLPHGDINIKHFGAVGGANLQEKTGPDDSAALEDALAYAQPLGETVHIDDYHNFLSEPFMSQGIVLDGHGLKGTGKYTSGVRVRIGRVYPTGTYAQAGTTTITVTINDHGLANGDFKYLNFTSGSATDGWFTVAGVTTNTFTVEAAGAATTTGNIQLMNFPENANAINLTGSGAYVCDLEIMAHQFSPRPPDRGAWGTNICSGLFGEGGDLLVSNCWARDVLLSRAPSTVGDLSYAAIGIIAVGNTEGYSWENISYDYTSGIGFTYGVSQHWGCTAEDPLGNPGTTYHPHDGVITFDGPLRGCTIGVGLSSSYNVDIGPFTMLGGAKALYILPGDNNDAYAVDRDVGKIMRGIRVGFINATLDAASAGDHAIEIFTQGQSKFETEGGTYKTRSSEADIIIEGSRLDYDGVCPANTDAIHVINFIGSIDLGRISSTGYSRRALFASNSGQSILKYDCVSSDQGIYLSGVRTVIGEGNAVSPAYDDSDTGGVTVFGLELAGTLAADSSAGAESSTLSAAFGVPVLPGDVLIIGTEEVVVTGSSHYDSVLVHHAPLLVSVSASASVTLKKRIKARLQGNTKGARYGMRFVTCEADIWGQGPTGAGQHGYRVEAGANVKITGAWPHATGQNSSTSTNYDLAVLAGGHVEIEAADIGPGDSQLEAHIDVAAGGSCHVSGVYRGSSTLVTATSAFGDFSFGRVVDASGVLVEKPGASGSDSNGYWTYNEDGVLKQWRRNVVTDASGDLTWTFPKTFLATASTVVRASPASTVNPFFAGSLNSNATTATIKTWNSSGVAATAAVNLEATGRWR